MFKVKKKDTRTMSTSNDVFLVNCEHVSYLLSSACDIDFKQVIFFGRVYSAGKNFTSRINPTPILPVKLKFYWQNKSRSYSAGKT